MAECWSRWCSVVGVLHQFFGLRFVMDGGGTPYPRFVGSSQLQAERIERHREAQRAAQRLRLLRR